ncbi:hypothetical protein [Leifsonia xyli]|uniref:hypothetical protein n=1 Tax=Leifsonia xyli TaxID=1575 RepID=UPI003D676A2D
MTSHYPDSQKTGQQLRIEAIEAMNAAITASGLPDGWHAIGPNAEPWNPPTEEFLGAGCTTQPGDDGQRFDVSLAHTPDDDPVAFAKKMGQFWADQGYTVSLVGDEDRGPEHDTSYRADRRDGSLYAAIYANAIGYTLSVYSECSTHPSLDMFAGPNGYRKFDWNDPNPYHPTNSPSVTPYPKH